MVSDRILGFYQSLSPPPDLPKDVLALNPYLSDDGWHSTERFYRKYYGDENKRKILFGINPGRLGGGITGVPFTDPVVLDEKCGIENPFAKRRELSSKFIYEMIDYLGGTEVFYQQYYITGISPLGYIRDGKNINYYDIPEWPEIFEQMIVQWIEQQLEFNIDKTEAFSIGKGENYKHLKRINKKYNFFDKIISLPHPRWVMQYRLKSKQTYLSEYKSELS